VSAGTIILIVVILVIVAVAAAVMSMRMRRRAAERTLVGPEYDRLADEVGPRKAKAEFEKRRQRVNGLGIRPLSAERRSAYAGQWNAAQEQFVDSPAKSASAAGGLITAVAVDRGYEVTDHDQLMADLSVYHGRYLDGYRRARQTTGQSGQASTEALRRALLEYRSLFFDLLESRNGEGLALVKSAESASPTTGSPDTGSPDTGPTPPPWRQVTQGLHWKTRQQESSDVASSRP
jgi:hypothetical protein